MKKKPPRALSLVLALALSLAACGTGAAPQPQGDTVPPLFITTNVCSIFKIIN